MIAFESGISKATPQVEDEDGKVRILAVFVFEFLNVLNGLLFFGRHTMEFAHA